MNTRARRTGLTLVELLLALASTAFIGLAVASMLHAVAYGAESGEDVRDLVPRHRVLSARIADAVRHAELVLDHSADAVVLWANDANNNDDYDSDELVWITYDGSTDEVTYAAANASHTPAAVAPGDLATTRATLSAAGELDEEVWARDVSAMVFDVDSAPVATKLVTWRTTLTFGSAADTQVHAEKVGGS